MATPRNPHICDPERSRLLIIDLQERLGAAMAPAELDHVVGNCTVLARAAGLLQVPVIATEQYPKGLGPTLPALRDSLPSRAVLLDKTSFSCGGAEGFQAALGEADRPQVVIAGMETHVCVLQTAAELLSEGRQVFVVADAVCSRTAANRDNALARLQAAGAVVTNTESVLFEWLRDARHDQFKSVSALIR